MEIFYSAEVRGLVIFVCVVRHRRMPDGDAQMMDRYCDFA